MAVWDESGKATRIAGFQTDITARKQVEKQLRRDASHDPLTGLPNRAYFRKHLQAATAEHRTQSNRLFAVLFLDIDQFKLVNDSLGHTVGDQLLIAISDRLKNCVRSGTRVARLGGDEFAIFLENINGPTEATLIAERIKKQMTGPFKVGEHEIFTSVSIGIALSSDGFEKPGDLLRNADTAMYQAKALGGGRHELFDQDMQRQNMELLRFETALRRALDRGEFLIHYQPIVSLGSGQITGCEALIRWQHPEWGTVGPSKFIAIAERTGLIVPISE